MIQIQEIVLVTRNARDKIQVATYSLNKEGELYIIKRYTGQFAGKITEQPEKIIDSGKANRLVSQQAELEFNSIIKKAVDKGYKKLNSLTKKKLSDLTAKELDSLVPTIKTDNNGNVKPQNAKSFKDCTINIWDKPMFCSKKLDGVRCLLAYNEDLGSIYSISRGGEDYNCSTELIRSDSELIRLFRKNPKLILDGEIYTHGWPLQKISGAARTKVWDDKCSRLEFWVFDIVDTEQSFSRRLDSLTKYELLFLNSEKIKFLNHEYVTGWEAVKKLHDKYVFEGFEGLVARKPGGLYQPGRRSSDWVKLKDYKEDTFKIIGYELGLRGVEDMVFVLTTSDKKTFKAKPIGDREDKQAYMEDMDNIIGKLGEVKYFNLSTDGTPTQPSFRAVRWDL